MGKSKPDLLDRLLDEVSRGRRDLGSIKDERLREAIRVALRIHRETPDAMDAYTRLRVRARVLGRLKPHGPTLADHAWTALELLARPAPILARSIAIAALLVVVGMGASVASAGTLPDDLLYPMKIATEGVRLALAGAPEDRAEVELSIAEHRLSEAERLASNGRTSDALVAAAVYSQHIAWAAAELAPRAQASDLPRQLEMRFEAQRARAHVLATSLASDTRSAPAARILAMIAAPSTATGLTGMQRVADAAAGVAAQLVRAAEENAGADGSEVVSFVTPAVSPSTTPTFTAPALEVAAPSATKSAAPTGITASPTTRATITPTPAPQNATPEPTRASRPSETERARRAVPTERATSTSGGPGGGTERATARPASSGDARSTEVLKTVRKALEEAKAAADKTKQHK